MSNPVEASNRLRAIVRDECAPTACAAVMAKAREITGDTDETVIGVKAANAARVVYCPKVARVL